MEVTASELFFYPDNVEDSAIFAIDFILAQQDIDNTLFTSTHNL